MVKREQPNRIMAAVAQQPSGTLNGVLGAPSGGVCGAAEAGVASKPAAAAARTVYFIMSESEFTSRRLG